MIQRRRPTDLVDVRDCGGGVRFHLVQLWEKDYVDLES